MAKKNNKEILVDLAAEINSFSQEIAKQLAINAREKLYEEANKAITKFYDHYDPICYERHTISNQQGYRWGYNIRKSIRKYYHAPHGTTFSGGIEMSYDWMDDIYRANTSYIQTLIYSGFHGNVNMFPSAAETIPPIMSPNPLQIILKKQKSLEKRAKTDALRIAEKIKNKANYRFIM